jgi:hypothetical protein
MCLLPHAHVGGVISTTNKPSGVTVTDYAQMASGALL